MTERTSSSAFTLPRFLLLSTALICLVTCIGDDFIFDEIEPELRISESIDTLGVGSTHQLTAIFLNNIGKEEKLDIEWVSSKPQIASVDREGVITGLEKGDVIVQASASYNGEMLFAFYPIVIDEETTFVEVTRRSGTLRTTSSYELSGDFELTTEVEKMLLSFADNYVADSGLPGLYIYLANNPNTIGGAHEIGKVAIFEGAHSYEVSSEVSMTEFKYVLYYCKPFNVKVGDGKFDD